MKTTASAPSSPNMPVRWSWHYRRLQSLRDRLLAGRDIHIAEASEPLEPDSMDMADSATDEFDHDVALSLLSHDQESLHEVDAAIRRILEGDYGICEETGRPIPAARLRAIPWTRFTREIAEGMERERTNSGPRLGKVDSIRDSVPAALSETEEPENEELLAREVAQHQRQADLEAIENGGGIAAAEPSQT